MHIGFKANPDQAFYVNADLDPDLGVGSLPMRIHADPDPQHWFKGSLKV